MPADDVTRGPPTAARLSEHDKPLDIPRSAGLRPTSCLYLQTRTKYCHSCTKIYLRQTICMYQLEKIPSRKVSPTALACMIHDLHLDFQSPEATVMTYLHAKVQGQRSIGSEHRVETNRRTDGGDCITSHANAVGNDIIQNTENHQHETIAYLLTRQEETWT